MQLLYFVSKRSSKITFWKCFCYQKTRGKSTRKFFKTCFLHKNIHQIFSCLNHSVQKWTMGLPWWHGGWESACQCRGHGFEPWSGKIPHAVEQLGPWATTTEPARLEPVLPTREAAIVRGPRTTMKNGPCLPQLEKALAQKRRPNTAKNKLIN